MAFVCRIPTILPASVKLEMSRPDLIHSRFDRRTFEECPIPWMDHIRLRWALGYRPGIGIKYAVEYELHNPVTCSRQVHNSNLLREQCVVLVIGPYRSNHLLFIPGNLFWADFSPRWWYIEFHPHWEEVVSFE